MSTESYTIPILWMSKPFSKHDLDQKGTINIQRTSIQYVYKNRIGEQGAVICVPDGNSLAEWKVNRKVQHACQLTCLEGLWGSSSQTLYVPGNKTLLSTLGKNRPWNASQPVKASLCDLSSKGLHQPTHAYI